MLRHFPHYRPITDYVVIGDCRSAALVSRDGSIDWLCLPRFDQPSIFAAILDTRVGGRFSVRPVSFSRVRRRYIEDTNVLETTFDTDGGVLRVTDCMPIASRAAGRRELLPDHEALRSVRCEAEDVDIEVMVDPRPDYGRQHPAIRHDRSIGYLWTWASSAFALQTDLPLEPDPNRSGPRTRIRLRAGEQRWLSFTSEEGRPSSPELGRPQSAASKQRSAGGASGARRFSMTARTATR